MKKYSVEFKWALVFSVMSLMWISMEKFSGLHDENISNHATITNLFAIPAILVYVFALLEKRKNNYNGIISWQQGFQTGLIITVFISLLVPLNQLLTHYIISPDYFNNIINESIRQGIISEQEATKYFSFQSYIFKSMFGAVVMGIISSAISALIVMKKSVNKPNIM
ncbi:MAG: DUF4199 domain-containing protein [Candidatus Kapabacteria bacterium]|nr:DUF4199 domain-containing protein [Ignavibacteriota bacterium]MCW5884295.1 DUF4199 domain-containing protein [Candidatus Kapabacteria bacterium]